MAGFLCLSQPLIALCMHTQIRCVNSVITVPINTKCPKCGTTNKGDVSCCARGGSWFQKCGDPGDTRFEYTWTEGINVCKGKLATYWICICGDRQATCLLLTNALVFVPVTDPAPDQVDSGAGTACPKCGTTKKGHVSCCARGATWFKKCGDPGDTNFEHDWDEGIDACKRKQMSC